jgi:hypothetical protein
MVHGPIGYAVDFAKEDINITFLDNRSYRYYNLSFWYYAESGCSYPSDHDVYISNENSFENWVSCVLNTGTQMSCGSWDYISMSIADEFWWKDPGFSLDDTFLGSINLEIMQGNMVYYDDIKLIPSVPETDWSCTDWGLCFPQNNTQYRTCTDACGTEYNKPSGSQNCTCTPDWQCGAWSTCTGGIQTRGCTDANECQTLTGQPPVQQACPLNPTSATVTVSPTTVNRGGEVLISATATDDDGISQVNVHITKPDNSVEGHSTSQVGSAYAYTYSVPADVQLGDYQVRVSVTDAKSETSWFIGENFTVVGYIDVQLSTDRVQYNQSDTVSITGTTKDAVGGSVSCGCQINFTSDSWSETIDVTSDGTFSYDKVISLVDPTGDWDVAVSCSGVEGIGSDSVSIEVSAPTRYEYYNVIVNSPVMGSIYYQGEDVQFTATVKEGEELVSGATVFTILPTGSRVTMVETANGVYSEVFRIPIDASTGSWNTLIRAIRGNYTGENEVNITVRESTITLRVLGPTILSHIPGEMVTIRMNATRSDGSAAMGLTLTASTPEGDLALSEVEDGVYEFSYIADQLGSYSITISGAEGLEFTPPTIDVHEPTPIDYLRYYWYLVVVAIVAVVGASYPLLKKRAGVSELNRLKVEKKTVQALQKDLQKAYFKRSEIDRGTFDKRSQEYEETLSKLDDEIKSKRKKTKK